MKKLTVIILALALVICLGAVSAFAAGPDNGAGFVDADNDGVCDNRGTGTGSGSGVGFVDADNDGVCDNRGTGAGSGSGVGFVDADNDGVCDNLGTCTGRGSGTGQGCGLRGGCRK